MTEPLLRAKDVARILGVSPKQPFFLAKRGLLPYVRFGRSVRWRREDVEEFIEKSRVAS